MRLYLRYLRNRYIKSFNNLTIFFCIEPNQKSSQKSKKKKKNLNFKFGAQNQGKGGVFNENPVLKNVLSLFLQFFCCCSPIVTNIIIIFSYNIREKEKII